MNMKKFRYFLLLLFSLVIVPGCSTNAIPDMTEEETRLVEEYAAQLLLKYDANYEPATLTEEEKAQEEEKLQQQAELQAQIQAQKEAEEEAARAEEEANGSASGEGNNEEAVVPEYIDIDEFLGLSGLEINYVDYQVCGSYPTDTSENDWQGVARASGSNQLVVFHFSISNQSGADYLLDMASMDTRFTFRVNNSINKTAITTLLTDDMIMYRNTIPNGETIDAVMLIELSAEDANAISQVSLVMKYDGQRAETTLL